MILGGRGSVTIVVALSAAVACVHCSSTDIVVATLPPHHDGHTEHRCVNDDDCHDEGFCVRDHCDDVAGHCEVRPVFCDAARAPTCGCDGVTYWNDCLRKRNGVTASTADPCSASAATCGGTAGPCPVTGASCARGCATAEPGACWMLPTTCPQDDGGIRFVPCDQEPSPQTCTDACSAIRSEKPQRPVGSPGCP